MKLSALIEQLQKIQDKSDADPTVTFNVKDSYATRGVWGEVKIDTDQTFHGGFSLNSEYLNINLDLKDDYEGRSPKVIFRK